MVKENPRNAEDFSGTRKSALAQRLDAALPKQHKKIAEAAGITSARLSAYRGGSRMPDPEMLARIARAAGINICWLLTGDGPQSADAEKKGDLSTARSGDEDPNTEQTGAVAGQTQKMQLDIDGLRITICIEKKAQVD